VLVLTCGTAAVAALLVVWPRLVRFVCSSSSSSRRPLSMKDILLRLVILSLISPGYACSDLEYGSSCTIFPLFFLFFVSSLFLLL
jgi:hypothetical protein